MLEPPERGCRRLGPLAAIATLVLAVAAPAQAAPATSHPRLLVRASDVPRLRSWATSKNPVWVNGLRALAITSRGRMDAGDVPDKDDGNYRYQPYPPELYAELFAFMSLVDPDADARADWGKRARTLLMFVVDRALPGLAEDGTPWRSPLFSTGDRSRFYGEGFGLTLDWAYPYFSDDDKQKIRTVFLRWANEQYKGYPLSQLSGTLPTPNGRANDPRLLRNRYNLRWSINNYYMAHARNLGLMAMAIDPADDPGGRLRSLIGDLTGQWLYVIDRMMRTDAAGGLSPEGFEYGTDATGRLAQLMYAMKTAGEADAAIAKLTHNRFWRDSVPAFLSSLPSRPVKVTGDNAFMSPLYQPAWFGDGETYWAADPAPLFAPLGLDARERGDSKLLNATRWAVKNTPPTGKGNFLGRAGGNTDNFFGAILYFLLFDPDAREPTDPRRSYPTSFVAPGIGRVLARTCWCASERLFTYLLSWSAIDHQQGNGNDFGFARKGEWLTKVRVSYGTPFTDFHNTVAIENDPYTEAGPDDYRTIGSKAGAQWTLEPNGDPRVLATTSTRGYTYALGDATNLYNMKSEKLLDVRHASRSIIWLQPDVIVTYDRADTRKAGRFKRVWLQFPAAASVSGKRATVSTPRGQKVLVTALAPGNARLTAEKTPQAGYPAAEEPMKFRLGIEATGNPRSARFLTVLQGADRNARPMRTVSVRGGSRFAGAVVGSTAVFFPVVVGRAGGFTATLPGGVRRVLVTGLETNARFTTRRSGSTLRVSPGGSTRANRAGVLDVKCSWDQTAAARRLRANCL